MLSETCRTIESTQGVSNTDLFQDFDLLDGHPWQETVRSPLTNYYSCLYQIIQKEKPVRILEIGTAFGLSAAAMIRGSENPELFISLDLGIYGDQLGFSQNNIDFARTRIHSWCCEHHIPLDRVRFYRANSQPEGSGDNEDAGTDIRRWHQIPDLIRLLTQYEFDVIFVDGKHTDDGLYHDFVTFWPMLKEGGLLICDDLHDEAVYRDIFPWAGQTLSSYNRFSKEHGHEISDSVIWNFPHVLPDDFRGLRPFGLIRKKKCEISPDSGKEFAVFDDRDAIEINKARLDHLASLGLDLADKSVLEVGSGVGKHTPFFEKLGCRVMSTDARPENVAENLRRHPHREGRVEVADLNITGSHTKFGLFDVIYCYGTLYHLSNPRGCLQELAGNCKDLFLLETCVNSYDNNDINCLPEENQWKNQSYDGTGCRPARNWIVSELKKHYPYVYCTRTQPSHRDFPLSWPADARELTNTRAVFVASKIPHPAGSLITEIPNQQPSLEPILISEGGADRKVRKKGTILETVRKIFRNRLNYSIYRSLFDKKGLALVKGLEIMSYGAPRDQGVLVQDATSILFQPTDVRDHLATPLLQLKPDGDMVESHLRLTVSFSSKYPPGDNCTIYLQDQAFTRISSPLDTTHTTSSTGEIHFISQTITVPRNVSKVRVLMGTTDGKPTYIPLSLRLEKLTSPLSR